MTKALWTYGGSSLSLGKLLGKGGEGSVFEVAGSPKLVAKLYHEAPTRPKQDKLRYMASNAVKELLSYSAWPTDTLHSAPAGPIVGFLMERVNGKQPVHMLYSPAHRKQDYPKAAWDFLLLAARNTAAAFEVIHAYGHVLGDVNQGNVMVGNDSRVLLIDSDSMQINATGRIHLCEVGVSHFTPPELQGHTSFGTVARTSNHDAFGLALLVFHLLFGGRHPFAGRPLRQDVGNGLEPDIAAFRFAYAFDAAQRGFAPPPNSIAFSMVPASTQMLFHRAFTEVGTQAHGRPRAAEWLAELDNIRKTLKSCGKTRLHVFPSHLTECPWCKLDEAGNYFFIDLVQVTTGQGSTFVLARIWAGIESVQPPRTPSTPGPSSFVTIPKPLPFGIKKSSNHALSIIVTLLVVAGLSWAVPQIAFLWVMGGLVVWFVACAGDNKSYIREKSARSSAKFEAEANYQLKLEQLEQRVNAYQFQDAKKLLREAKASYERFSTIETQFLSSVQEKARTRQLSDFLSRIFLDSATISGLGPAKKAALRSFGIETAADVKASRVSAVQGFGPVLTAAMMAWHAEKVRGFRFDSSPQALLAETAKVKYDIALQRQKVENVLSGGLERLSRLKVDAESSIAKLLPPLQIAAREFSQATADLLP